MSSLRQQDGASLCRLTFADGRQCRTPRCPNHPHFCYPYHPPLPKLSVLCVSAPLCDNRFPSFSLTHLNATHTRHPASVDSKPLTAALTLLDATLTQNIGGGVILLTMHPMVSG
jgi:hypothetical protein